MKILLIEDDPNESLAMLRKLIHSGICSNNDITEVSSIEAGRCALETNKFDIVICDLGLTDILGPEVIIELQNASPTTPIIVTTCDDEDETLADSFKFGAEDFLCKDEITPAGLRRCIKNAIERKKLKNDLAQASRMAEVASTAKSSFLAKMSHEIRTPLNLIVGSADLLNETRLNPQQSKYVNIFSKASSHLLNVINNVLDMAKIESGDLIIEESAFHFENEINKVAEMAAMSCRSKKIEFEYYVSPDIPPFVKGDPGRVKQILLNLINNSVKYTEQGYIKLIVEAHFPMIHFKIEDSGPGIPREKSDKIFDSFYQIHRKGAKAGTGLGLTIAKELAIKMNGDLYLDLSFQKGTRFNLNLPLIDSQQESSLTKLEPPSLQGIMVLIMAMGELERLTLQQSIQTLGGYTEVVNSGQAALIALSHDTERRDFIILDIQMKDLGAFNVLKQLKYKIDAKKLIFLLPPIHRKNDLMEIESHVGAKYIYKPLSHSKICQIFLPSKKITKTSYNFSKQSYKILIAEDDLDNQDLIRAYMKGFNHNLTFAKDGQEAFECFQNNKFDLILMDIQMPRLDGLKATELIRGYEKQKGHTTFTPIYGLSANAYKEDVQLALKSGFTGYMTKPLKKERLLQLFKDFENSLPA